MEQTKLSVSTIETYPTNILVWDTVDGCHYISLDNQFGEFTRDEWKEDPIIELFDEEGQEKILDTLDRMEVFSEE